MADTKILNEEQIQAIEHSEGPLLIIAGAGTGKTTVITERIKHLILNKKIIPSEILALTFTEKASQEMEERVDIAMPYGYTQMWISTFHSFCDRILRSEAIHIGLNPSFKLISEAESILFLRKNLFTFNLDYFRPLGNPTKFLIGMLQHFSRLKDEDISPDEYLKYAKKLNAEPDEIKKTLELAHAYQKYEELKIKEGLMDFSDLISNTLKLFRERPNILEQYKKQFKYVLIDEFQDTNIAQNELMKLLVVKTGNIAVVADDDQCLPPNSLVSLHDREIPIKKVKVGTQVVTAVGKGYLSLSKVVYVNKTKKKTKFITFTTESGKKVEITDNHKMFCMIPGRKYGLGRNYYVYLMYRSGIGWRLGITDDLAQRLKLERSADKILAIKSCSSLEEARFWEVIYSLRYQIPTYPFKPRKRMILTGEWLQKLFSQFDTEKNAQVLAQDLAIDLNTHHFCLGAVVRGNKERIKIRLDMCYRRYRTELAKRKLLSSPKVLHQVFLETSSQSVRTMLEKTGLNLIKTTKGIRVRKSFARLSEAGEFAIRLQKITGGTLEVGFYVAKRNGISRRALVMPAGNILPGMSIPVKRGFEIVYEKVIKREENIKTETVYDLEIENTHNFIADGIVVHNSIYKWRGAAISNVIQFRKSFPKTKIVSLTQNYRSTQRILDSSYKLIQNNNPDRLEVQEKVSKKLNSMRKIKGSPIEFLFEQRVEDEAEIVRKKIQELLINKKYQYKDIAILLRANDYSQPFVRTFIRHAIPFQFLGPGRLFHQEEIKDLISYLKVLYNFEDSASLYRILNLHIFKIESRDIAALLNFSRRKNLTLFEGLEHSKELSFSEEVQKKMETVLSMIKSHLKRVSTDSAGQILYYFLQDSGLLKKFLGPESAKDEKKYQNIAKFFDKLKTYEAEHQDASVFAVVDWIDLSMQMGESPLATDTDWTEVNAVNILTVHSSKGLEFPIVFLVNLVAQRFPVRERTEQIPIPQELIKEILPTGDFHLQEERRLFYVGMTRARDFLFFTASHFYGEGKRERKISPFVYEALGQEYVEQFLKTQKVKQMVIQPSLLEWTPQAVSSPPPTMNNEQRSTVHINYISYSQIQTFAICPLHYKLKYILKIPSEITSALSFGTSIHSALREFFRAWMEDGSVSKNRIITFLKNVWTDEGYQSKAHEKQAYERASYILSHYLNEYFNPKIAKPVAVEVPFTIILKDSPKHPTLKVAGRIDRIDKITGEKIEIIDYKTGNNIPEEKKLAKDLQLTMYGFAAHYIQSPPFNRKPEDIILSLFYLEEDIKLTTVRTLNELEECKSEIFAKVEEIEKSDFSCSGSILCKNCEYKMLCSTS